jgi:pimeloyl-[acyl-carrier protein] methyl ester esterase
MRRFVLLPGLDGTGTLFDDFVRTAPADVRCDVVALPREPLSYAELGERIAPQLQLTPETILLAESFSGPIAMQIAAGERLAALVLCNTFVAPPAPSALAALPLTLFFHLPLPAFFIRRYLVGPNASDALVARVRVAVESVSPRVLASRLSNVLRVDVAGPLGRCSAPIVYLRSTQDNAVPDASVRALVSAASVPIQVVRIPAPHLLLQAAPEAAWRAIEDSLADLRSA